jgi:hypothetical protein
MQSEADFNQRRYAYPSYAPMFDHQGNVVSMSQGGNGTPQIFQQPLQQPVQQHTGFQQLQPGHTKMTNTIPQYGFQQAQSHQQVQGGPQDGSGMYPAVPYTQGCVQAQDAAHYGGNGAYQPSNGTFEGPY